MLGLDCFIALTTNHWLIRYSISLLFISMLIGGILFPGIQRQLHFAWLIKVRFLKVQSHLNLSLAFCRKRTLNFNVI